jgi:hypothetical protein
MKKTVALCVLLACWLIRSMPAHAQVPIQYRVLATNKTSTMQKELNEAGDAGFRFRTAMGGQTSFGGSEVVVITQKTEGSSRFEYRLLATSKTSTMQKELQEAAEAGFRYVGQSVFKSTFGGSEVACFLERDSSLPSSTEGYQYRLLATSKTSTMQKELQEAGEQGFEIIGMTVGETALGGSELVSILRRKVK